MAGSAADVRFLAAATRRRRRWEPAVKRTVDVVVSAILLVILSPLLAAIAIAVKLGDGGPVLYRWPVVGQHGRYFIGYKFRTMVVEADQIKERLLEQNEATGPAFKMKHDPRVTPVGRVLRRFSLDELPQLWSVLRGDMSLVGPRPPLQSEYACFTERQKQKLAAKPGITCLWQISGRSEIRDFDRWLSLDLEYIRRQSIWLDLLILLQTIPAVLRGRGAW
ncbi:MAG: sugar transferase [Chloroflexi bacterium]|nr:sugar transferase [Chloroflexota bacterium]